MSVQLRPQPSEPGPLPPSSPGADSALFLPRGRDSIHPGGARSRGGPSRELSWAPPHGTETRRGLCQVRASTRAHGNRPESRTISPRCPQLRSWQTQDACCASLL